MDEVPTAFWKHLCDVLHSVGLSEVKKVSGNFGEVAQFIDENVASYVCAIEAGKEKGYLLYTRSGRKKLVDRQKLRMLWMQENACGGKMFDVLQSLLSQHQFRTLQIKKYNDGQWNTTIVRNLFEYWSKYSEKLKGLHLALRGWCEGGIDQLKEFVLQRTSIKTKNVSAIHEVIKVCSKKECTFIAKYTICSFIKRSCFYKFEEGEGGEQRKFYIFFECANEEERRTGQSSLAASHNGQNDLGLMRTTNHLRVFFE
uniref:F-box domain-containing protein n=1 Tax=Steinernema glaseri TaxID=37863 RepID=A0A1I7Y4F4_9BILA